MRRQKEIDWEMRSTLVDWLVEVGEEFKLCNETLFLSVAYVDRFLSIMSCTRDKLQLAGVAAMFIAALVKLNYSSKSENLLTQKLPRFRIKICSSALVI